MENLYEEMGKFPLCSSTFSILRFIKEIRFVVLYLISGAMQIENICFRLPNITNLEDKDRHTNLLIHYLKRNFK